MARWYFAFCLMFIASSRLAGQDIDFERPPVGSFADSSVHQDSAVVGVDHRVASANGQAHLETAIDGEAVRNAIRPFVPASAGDSTDSGSGLLQLANAQLRNIDWQKMLLSLGIVVGGYVVLMFLLRWMGNGSGGALPREVIEVLGAAPLNSKQNLQLVRLGSKLLLLLHGPEGTHSLGEISNPHEVEHLAQVCCSRRGRRAPTAFKKFASTTQTESSATPSLDTLLRSLQTTLQRGPARTEYEA